MQEIYLLLGDFPSTDSLGLSPKDMDKAEEFSIMYKTHAACVMDCILRANFYQIQDVMLNFWRSVTLPMLSLLAHPVMVQYVADCDTVLYTAVNDVLVPDPCQPLTVGLMQALKDFVQNLHYWIEEEFSLMPKALATVKLQSAIEFKTSVLRQLQISHMTLAARETLDNTETTDRLCQDWQYLHLDDLVLKCRSVFHTDAGYVEFCIRRYVAEFDALLSQTSTRLLSNILDWTKSVVQSHKQQMFREDNNMSSVAIQDVILKWNFISSQILHQLSLAQIKSYGTLHLMDMLLRDFAIYLLQRRMKY